MIVSMFTGYAYVKSMNRAKKKEYITMQAQADDGGTWPVAYGRYAPTSQARHINKHEQSAIIAYPAALY